MQVMQPSHIVIYRRDKSQLSPAKRSCLTLCYHPRGPSLQLLSYFFSRSAVLGFGFGFAFALGFGFWNCLRDPGCSRGHEEPEWVSRRCVFDMAEFSNQLLFPARGRTE